jgi:small conductance mechanosensitive channel
LQDKDTYNKGLRAMFLIGSTILELIPVGAFAAAAYGLLPLLEPSTPTQLVALTLINAIVLVRIILVLVKLLLVPEATALRILPLDNESVHYLYIWVRRVAALGVYGYFILEAALLLGLPQSLYTFLLKILGLVITAMAAVLILQNRKEVANWLRGDQQPLADNELKADSKTQSNMDQKKQTIKALRGRLADFWHIAAIVLIGGMFGTWALEIEGGFQFLARAIVLTVMVVALASFLVRLSMRGMQQLFKISEDLKQKFPDLEARANRYLPILNNIIKGAIYIVAVFSILQAWGLGALSWLFSAQGQGIVSSLFVMALIICGAFLLWEIVSSRIKFSLEREKMLEGKKDNTRKLTLLPLISNVIRISLILVAGMSVLAHLGINIAPLLAGAGVIGLAIGFGAQTLVKDVITGAFILMENSIAVGDWVEAGGHAGTVEHLTVRTLTLRDLNGTVHVVPFGDVTSVLNYNRDYGYAVIDAGVAYRENYGEVVQALQDVASELQQDEKWGGDIIGDLEVFGLNNLGDSAVEVRVRLKTRPLCQFAVRRAFLERMKRTFDERDIEIPFPHQTVWFGIDKEGQAPAMRVIHEKDKTLPVSKEAEKETAQPQAGPEINYYTETDAAKDVVEEKKQGEEDEKQQSS